MSKRRLRFDIRQAGKRLALVLGVWFVLNVAFYLGLVRPRVELYQGLEGGTDERFQALEQRRGQVEAREAFLAGLQQAEGDLKTFREEVLSTRALRLTAVQAELENLCNQFRIDLDSVNFDNDELPAEELELFRMIVPLEGGYAALRRFLQAVESSTEFLVVDRVVIGVGKEGGVMLQLNITLDTYFKAPPGALPRPPAGRTRRPSRA